MQLLSMEQRLMDKRKWSAAHTRVRTIQKQLDGTKQQLIRAHLEVSSMKSQNDAFLEEAARGEIIEENRAGSPPNKPASTESQSADDPNVKEHASATADDLPESWDEARVDPFAVAEVKEVRCLAAVVPDAWGTTSGVDGVALCLLQIVWGLTAPSLPSPPPRVSTGRFTELTGSSLQRFNAT